MTTTRTGAAGVDLDAIKTRQQGVWASGDFAVIGTPLQIVGEQLCEAMDVAAGWRVLEVAAGHGNAALAAARRGCEVTATDYVPELLDRLVVRAAAEGLQVQTRAADAEALPFPDASFDAVISTFGVMFAPDQARAGAELVRVCRPGGCIGLANWTPDSFVGHMLRTVGRYVPPPAGLPSPLEWGVTARVGELLGPEARSVDATERTYVFRYRSAHAWLDVFRTYYGPFVDAFAALDSDSQRALAGELVTLAEEHNPSTDGTLRVPSTYLEIVAMKAGSTASPNDERRRS